MKCSMASARKSWLEKFHNGKAPVVEILDKPFAKMPAGAKMLIASPAFIEECLFSISKGERVPIEVLRTSMAASFNADFTCPLTTGIFLRIVAEKNYQEFVEGKPIAEIAPFWRVLSPNMPLLEKFSFPLSFVQERWLEEAI